MSYLLRTAEYGGKLFFCPRTLEIRKGGCHFWRGQIPFSADLSGTNIQVNKLSSLMKTLWSAPPPIQSPFLPSILSFPASDPKGTDNILKATYLQIWTIFSRTNFKIGTRLKCCTRSTMCPVLERTHAPTKQTSLSNSMHNNSFFAVKSC